MRFVIDMNLSTDWVEYLGKLGHDAVHWASVGPQDAPDEDIVDWARSEDRTILTNDLDFGTLLVSTGPRSRASCSSGRTSLCPPMSVPSWSRRSTAWATVSLPARSSRLNPAASAFAR